MPLGDPPPHNFNENHGTWSLPDMLIHMNSIADLMRDYEKQKDAKHMEVYVSVTPSNTKVGDTIYLKSSSMPLTVSYVGSTQIEVAWVDYSGNIQIKHFKHEIFRKKA